jgi:hypothetical protein
VTYKDPAHRLWLFCIAEKYTSKPLTETAEAWAYSPYGIADIAKQKWPDVKVDGTNTYVDMVDVTPLE